MKNNKNLDDGYVYFIQCGKAGPIKIGFSKHKSAESRLTTAQVYNPIQLTLLTVMPGGRAKETELHKQFVEHNIVGEWFQPNTELSKIIDQHPYLGLSALDFQRSGPAHQEHHFWKGSGATDASKRSRTIRRFEISANDNCQNCKVVPAVERYHLDGQLDNIDPENIILVCRRCCMELDGRLDELKSIDHSYQITPPQPCIICRKLSKPLRKGRCHACNEYFRRHNKERSELLDVRQEGDKAKIS